MASACTSGSMDADSGTSERQTLFPATGSVFPIPTLDANGIIPEVRNPIDDAIADRRNAAAVVSAATATSGESGR